MSHPQRLPNEERKLWHLFNPRQDHWNHADALGPLLLDRLPTMAEAREIRLVLGIPKRVEYSPEALAAKRAWASTVAEKKPVFPSYIPIKNELRTFC
jgi:hypothetical protein